MSLFVSVILLAGGKGSRMQSATPKQFLPLKGAPVISYSLNLFLSLPYTKEVIIVCDPLYNSTFPQTLTFAPSGARRQDSLWNGLQKVSPQADLVCIHDAARPLLRKVDALAVIEEAAQHGAAALAVPAKNTIKECNEDGFVVKTPDRTHLREMQTPQVIKPDLLRKGFTLAKEQNLTVTDDVALVEITGHPVKLVFGSYSNIKLTTQDDWPIAEALLKNEI